jgi:phospholipid/cholesterol/gamma-HCH transport system substrate-binding protein
MQNATGNNIKLGIFISAGIVLFATAVYFIGQKQQLFSRTFQVSCVFKDVSGLQEGNNVRFSGINIGIVKTIELITDSSVRVDMTVNEDVRKFIRTNAKAIIGSDGLMGNKIIIIRPGTMINNEISDNAFIGTSEAVSMDDILLKVKMTADNASHISSDLAIIMDNVRHGRGTIGELVMDKKMAHNVDDAVVNIKQGAGGFKNNMDAASDNFLLKGFFKKKAKAEAKKKAEEEKADK